MGHKSVSKRKPKKNNSFSTGKITGASKNTLSGENLPVQPFVTNNGASLNKSGTNPAAGSSKKHRKGK
jgi:hypothetical protein